MQLGRHGDGLVHRRRTVRSAGQQPAGRPGRPSGPSGARPSPAPPAGRWRRPTATMVRRTTLLATLPWKRLELEERQAGQWRRLLGAYDYQRQLERGYSVTRGPDGSVVRSTAGLAAGDPPGDPAGRRGGRLRGGRRRTADDPGPNRPRGARPMTPTNQARDADDGGGGAELLGGQRRARRHHRGVRGRRDRRRPAGGAARAGHLHRRRARPPAPADPAAGGGAGAPARGGGPARRRHRVRGRGDRGDRDRRDRCGVRRGRRRATGLF